MLELILFTAVLLIFVLVILIRRDRIFEITWYHFPVFIFNRSVNAITLHPFIFYKHRPADRLKRHEWIHIDQVRSHGWLNFYFKYVTSKQFREQMEHIAYARQGLPRGEFI